MDPPPPPPLHHDGDEVLELDPRAPIPICPVLLPLFPSLGLRAGGVMKFLENPTMIETKSGGEKPGRHKEYRTKSFLMLYWQEQRNTETG